MTLKTRMLALALLIVVAGWITSYLTIPKARWYRTADTLTVVIYRGSFAFQQTQGWPEEEQFEVNANRWINVTNDVFFVADRNGWIEVIELSTGCFGTGRSAAIVVPLWMPSVVLAIPLLLSAIKSRRLSARGPGFTVLTASSSCSDPSSP